MKLNYKSVIIAGLILSLIGTFIIATSAHPISPSQECGLKAVVACDAGKIELTGSYIDPDSFNLGLGLLFVGFVFQAVGVLFEK